MSAGEATGLEPRWLQTEEDEKIAEEEIGSLLSDGLTANEAAKIALFNNRRLQAAFQEIGMSKADLVQAGLFGNPNVSATFKFPSGEGDTETEVEGVVNIADLWQVPLRRQAAESRLDATLATVSQEMIVTVAEAKHAHSDCVALAMILDEISAMEKEMERFREHVAYRQKFGFSSDLDVHLASAAVLDQELAAARAEKELRVARALLNRVLGLAAPQSGYQVVGTLRGEMGHLPDLDTLVRHAFSKRPDMQAARFNVDHARRTLVLERRIFTDVEAGVAYKHDADGADLIGPKIGLRIPLFDQKQAQIARAEYRVRQAERELEAKKAVVSEEVAAALEGVLLAREESEMIRDKLLPLREEAVAYTERYSDAMQLNMLYLLEARRSLLESKRRYIESLRDLRSREIELERGIGGMVPVVEHKH